jgi:hypothetical protein
MNLEQALKTIDRAIKNTWVTKISRDYRSYYLLKEDT